MRHKSTANKIKKISEELLKESRIERTSILEKNGLRLTNFYSDNVTPIGMLTEEQKDILRSYFRDRLDDYYYVENV